MTDRECVRLPRPIVDERKTCLLVVAAVAYMDLSLNLFFESGLWAVWARMVSYLQHPSSN